MAKGVGIDLVQVKRIARLWKRFPDRFPSRFLSKAEIKQFEHQPQTGKVRFLAGRYSQLIFTCFFMTGITCRWAVKEAVYKALEQCKPEEMDKRIDFRDIQVLVQPGVKVPTLNLEKLSCVDITNGLISISHDGDYATAIAILH